MSPVAPIAHLIAIVIGVGGGLWLGGVIAPDLPSAETEPGVVASDDSVKGSDPDSLFRRGPLQEAVDQTLDQFAAGDEVTNVTIEPGSLRAARGKGTNTLPLEAMPVDAPERMLPGIEAARRKAGVTGEVTLDDVRYFSWSSANPTANEWQVLLDVSTAGPPTQFEANRDGTRVRLP